MNTSNIINAWAKSQKMYQERYASYAKSFASTGNVEDRGHMLECSYVLISLFGLTGKEVEQLEKHDYAGLLDREIEDEAIPVSASGKALKHIYLITSERAHRRSDEKDVEFYSPHTYELKDTICLDGLMWTVTAILG